MLQRSSPQQQQQKQHLPLFVLAVLAGTSLPQSASGVRSVAEKEKEFLKEPSSRLRSPHLAQAYEDYLQGTTGYKSAVRPSFAQETSRTRRVRSRAKEVPGYPGSLDPEKVEEAKIARSEYQDDWSREWKLGPPRKRFQLAEEPDTTNPDESEVAKSGLAGIGRRPVPGLGLLLLLTAAAWAAN